MPVSRNDLMKPAGIALLAVMCLFLVLTSCPEGSVLPGLQPDEIVGVPVIKTNSMKIWMHYMPWFDAPYNLGPGNYGWHWTMNTRDPNQIDANTGQQHIASHFYPLIGPYASRDPAVIEYHILLMKYAGIDGVLIDWYGSRTLHDFGTNLVNANALINRLSRVGLDFAIVYEDWTAGSSVTDFSVLAAQSDLAYVKQNYFSRDNYIRYNEKNLFLIFGPRIFNSIADWTAILDGFTAPLELVPLCYRRTATGSSGEYMWPFQDGSSHKSHLLNFYNHARQLDFSIGSVYPGFKDYYAEGGAGDTLFFIDPYDGSSGQENENPAATFQWTLSRATDANARMIQVATWNDFGEGTQVEPTVETGFTYVQILQKFAGVAVDPSVFTTILSLYRFRRAAVNDVQNAVLDACFEALADNKPDEAAVYLAGIDLPQ